MTTNIYNALASRQLFDGCLEYYTWLRFFAHRFYSFYNIALLFIQRPYLTDFHTETQWEKKNRHVKPGANPLVIITPNGPATLVYERNDTYSDRGKEDTYAEGLKKAIYGNKNYNPIGDECLPGFIAALERMGIYYEEERTGEALHGRAALLGRPMKFFQKKNNGINEVWSRYAVIVNSIDSPEKKAKTLLHEIGHILCGHLGTDKENTLTKVKDRKHENLSHDTEEFEAELTCDMLCRMLGYANDSSVYLKDYTPNGHYPSISLDAIVFAAETFLNVFDSIRNGR